ncbi:MAG TPA: phosphonate-binding protein, partial [Caulobacteraceae bacterium]|nr:phosphonate-binding protein [Caulobacteraceae bacterium]
RFIDRRTSALLRGLQQRQEILAGVGPEGDVTVEGHYVGKLRGLRFEPVRGASALEDKALRAAAERVVGPELAKRMGQLAAEPDGAFGLLPDGTVTWRGEAAGRVVGEDAFHPRVGLFAELGSPHARERAVQRLETFLAAEARRKLRALHKLQIAKAKGALKGLARGIAWRMIEAGGVLDRAEAAADIRALSQAERRSLQIAGVRFGAFSLFLPGMLKPEALAFNAAFVPASERSWATARRAPFPLPHPAPTAKALARRGLRAVGSVAVPVEMLERLDSLLRAGPSQNGGQVLTEDALATLGWSAAQAHGVLRALGFAPVAKPKANEPPAWRRRRAAHTPGPATATNSPFSALANLKPAPTPVARPRRRPRRASAGST